MDPGRAISLIIAGILATVVSLYIESRIQKTKWHLRILLPVRSRILRLLIGIAAGIGAAFITQPWNPPPNGWPLWKAALFIGFCFFGVWGALALRYWASRKAQERGNESENDSDR